MRKITALLEESMYEHYLMEQPKLVEGIRVLLTAGESKEKVKQFIESKVGKSLTGSCVKYMIDYVSKQINN